jgi:hypothetical protein
MNDLNKKSVSNWYRMMVFLRRYRHILILWPLLSALTILVFGIASLHFPAIGEALMYNATIVTGLLQFGFTATVILFGIGAAALFATLMMEWSIQRLSTEIRLASLAKQLPQYEGGDFFCVQNLENGAETIRTAKAIESALPPDAFMGVLLYQSNVVTITHRTKLKPTAHVIERKEFVPDHPATDFTTETASDFYAYAQQARIEFQNYCAAVRVNAMKELGTGAAAYIAQNMKVACLALFLLFSVGLSAQSKTERVNAGLGAAAQVVPKAGAVVVYTFENGGVTRTADGKLTVAELVASGRIGADADDKGALLGVDIAGLAITAAPQTKAVQPETPKPLFQTRKEAVINAMPDSVQFDQKLKGAENYFDATYTGLSEMFGKVWASHLSGVFINIVLILFLLFTFFTNVCNNEVVITRAGRVYNKSLANMAMFFMFFAFVLGIVSITPILACVIWYMLEGDVLLALMVAIQWKVIITVAMLLVMRSLVVRFVDWIFVAPKSQGGGYSGHNERGGNPRLNG